MSKEKFVVFAGHDEVIVTTKACEKKTVKVYFTDGGRNLDEYDRSDIPDHAVCVVSKIAID